MTDDISKVVPFWEWKEKQKAIDDEANGGVPLLRSKDWYHREYGKYVATIQRQGYASFNKGTLTVDVGQFLKDTRTESATTPTEAGEVDHFAASWRGDWNSTMRGYAEEYARRANATLARQLAEAKFSIRLGDEQYAKLLAKYEQAESQLAEAMSDAERLRAYRDATFDGNAVYAALDDRTKARTSADNVADVLDALNRVARLASEREGLDTPTKPRYNCPTEAHDGEE